MLTCSGPSMFSLGSCVFCCCPHQVIQPKSEECDHIKFLIEEKDSEEEAFYEDLDGFEENGTQETRISPYTFCKAFPFHLMFDRELVLTQCGNAIFRVLPQVRAPWQRNYCLPWCIMYLASYHLVQSVIQGWNSRFSALK